MSTKNQEIKDSMKTQFAPLFNLDQPVPPAPKPKINFTKILTHFNIISWHKEKETHKSAEQEIVRLEPRLQAPVQLPDQHPQGDQERSAKPTPCGKQSNESSLPVQQFWQILSTLAQALQQETSPPRQWIISVKLPDGEIIISRKIQLCQETKDSSQSSETPTTELETLNLSDLW